MGFSDFAGARNSDGSGVIPLSQEMYAYLGDTEALLTNPDPAIFRRLWTHIETAGVFIRPGNYIELTFNSTSDVDDTNETIIITGVEGRMVPIKDVSNSLTHTVGGVEATDDRLIYGPVQLATATLLPVGLVVDTSYWIAKALDAGVATDEVCFYASEADARAASTLAVDDRIALTAAVGTATFAGMDNNGLSTLPHAASITDGYSSFHLDGTASTQVAVLSAADAFTIVGDGATADMSYWWTP